MFCNQCEQTAKGTGCTQIGVCGKQPDVAALQDLLIYACQGLSVVAHEAAQKGVQDKDTDEFLYGAVFSTLTNVNFDPARFLPLIHKAVELRECMKARTASLGVSLPACECLKFTPAADLAGLVKQGEAHATNAVDPNADVQSLKQTVIYGIKGVAAYADHAAILGQYDPSVAAYIYEAFAKALRTDLDLGAWVDLAMRCGMFGVQEWLSFYWKSPMTAPGLYPENDLFIQQTKLKNTLRYMMEEDLITHLGLEYYNQM